MKLAAPVSAGSIALGKMYGQSETSIFSGGGGAKYRIITVDGVGERGEQLGLSLLLLQLLKEQDQLHSDTSKTTTVGSVKTTIAGGMNDKNKVTTNLKDKT